MSAVRHDPVVPGPSTSRHFSFVGEDVKHATDVGYSLDVANLVVFLFLMGGLAPSGEYYCAISKERVIDSTVV